MLIGWIASAISISGVLLNAKKKISCWPVWIFASFIWIYISIENKDIPQLILWSVFAVFDAYGWYQWNKERKNIGIKWIPLTLLGTKPDKLNLNLDEYPPEVLKKYADKTVNPAYYGLVTFGHVPSEEVEKFENDYHITE